MSKSIEEYLAELRKRLSKRLSPSEVEGHLIETRQHLECAAEEAGGSSEGELQAIEQFGRSSAISEQIIRARLGQGRLSQVALLVSLCLPVGISLLISCCFYIFGGAPEPPVIFCICLAALALVAFLVLSTLAKRPSIVKVLQAGTASLFIFPLASCLIYVPLNEDQLGVVPRFRAQEFAEADKRENASVAAIKSTINAARKAYDEHDSASLTRLHTSSGYVVPTVLTSDKRVWWDDKYALSSSVLPTLEQAEGLWKKDRGIIWQTGLPLETGEGVAHAVNVESELRKPLLSNYGRFFKWSAQPLAIYFLIMLLLHLVCTSLGRLTRYWIRNRKAVA